MPQAELKEALLHDGRVSLSVRPSAPKTQVKQQNEGIFKMDVGAPPTQDKANREIGQFLSALVGRKVKVTKGRRSRRKVASLQDE